MVAVDGAAGGVDEARDPRVAAPPSSMCEVAGHVAACVVERLLDRARARSRARPGAGRRRRRRRPPAAGLRRARTSPSMKRKRDHRRGRRAAAPRRDWPACRSRSCRGRPRAGRGAAATPARFEPMKPATPVTSQRRGLARSPSRIRSSAVAISLLPWCDKATRLSPTSTNREVPN